MHSTDHAVLAKALLNLSVYGHAVDGVEKIETHISDVFLAGPYAYKIKKPVYFGFLDFRTLGARSFYCQEELRLNRRFAPALYLDVIAITGSPDHPALGGDGAVIEYAVKMRRFSQDHLFNRLLARNQLTHGHIDQLATKIAAFHSSAAVASASDAYGTTAAIQQPAMDSFAQIRAAMPDPDNFADLDFLEQWTAHQCEVLAVIFNQRKKAGFVRECHGDLHSGNVTLLDDEVTMFDCIEFNENLRWIDVINEVAFLVMDLHDKKRPDLARRFLNRYLECTGDYGGLRVLQFYFVYRAMVRAKVHCLRANQPGLNPEQKAGLLAQYHEYLALAKGQTTLPCPAVFITHGFSGSGKTTATESLMEILDAVRIRSDIERKRLQGLPALAQTGSGIQEGPYSTDATALTYRRLLDLAGTVVEAGYTVIVDATFLTRSQRDAFRGFAKALNLPFHILNFVADEATMRTRLLVRWRKRDDASEADIPVLEHQLRTAEPLQFDELPSIVTYDSGRLRSEGERRHFWISALDRLGIGMTPCAVASTHEF